MNSHNYETNNFKWKMKKKKIINKLQKYCFQISLGTKLFLNFLKIEFSDYF